MRIKLMVLGFLVVFLALAGAKPRAGQTTENASNAPTYTADGKLKYPARYREWIYLTSGVDMSYSPQAMAMGHSMFDNVFVNPEAYQAFLATGTWPDKTVMVLEARMAGSKSSINEKGQFQTGEVMAREVHVKDAARFPGKWAFFWFDNEEAGELFPKEATCYSCHEQHAAVDTTFVQFYPTLLPIAKSKNTLSAAYVKEEAAASKTEKKSGGKDDYKP
jgi:Cytochrome P460